MSRGHDPETGCVLIMLSAVTVVALLVALAWWLL